MAKNVKSEYISKIEGGATGTLIWTLDDWKNGHKMLSQEADCILEIGGVKLRFFFRPLTKNICGGRDPAVTIEYYSLYMQNLSNHRKVCIYVYAKNITSSESSYDGRPYESAERASSEAYVVAKTSAENPDGVTVAVPEFFKIGGWYWDFGNCSKRKFGRSDFVKESEHLKIRITCTLLKLKNQSIQEEIRDLRRTSVDENKEETTPINNQIQRLLQDHSGNLFADISLKMQDNSTLPCHRLILASASPVFEAMLTSGLKETHTCIVEIPDVSSDVMKILIQYMYSGNVDSASDLSREEVIYAASKYQLGGLIEYCDNALIKICNPGNVCELLGLANKYNLLNAIEELKKYIEIYALQIARDKIKNELTQDGSKMQH